MRKIVTVLVGIWMGMLQSSFGQGLINMNSAGPPGVLRFVDCRTGEPVYDNLVVGLYWGVSPQTVDNLVTPLARIVGPDDTTNSSQWGFVLTLSGGGNRSIPSRAGIETYFQLRAWTSGYASWEEALASGNPAVRLSLPKNASIARQVPTWQLGQPVPSIPWGGTAENPILVFFTPFCDIPEPSVIALLLGALAAVWPECRRRR